MGWGHRCCREPREGEEVGEVRIFYDEKVHRKRKPRRRRVHRKKKVTVVEVLG